MNYLVIAFIITFMSISPSFSASFPLNFLVEDSGGIYNPESTTGCTLGGTAGGSMANESTIKAQLIDSSGTSITNTGSIKVTTVANGNAQIDCTVSVSFKDAHILGEWVYVEDKTLATGIFIAISSGSCSFAVNFQQNPINVGLDNGWNFIPLSRQSWSIGGAESWSNTIVCIRRRITTSTASPTSVYFDAIQYGFYSQPCVIFTFSGISDTQFSEAYTIFHNSGVHGTLFSYHDGVGTSGKLTEGNIASFATDNWEIGNGGKTNTNYTTLTQAQIEAELADQKAWLQARKYRNAWNIAGLPSGGYDSDVEAAMTSQGILLAISQTNRRQPFAKGIANSRYNLYATKMDNNITLTTAKTYIDKVVESGSCQIFNFLLFDAAVASTNQWSTPDTQDLVNYAKAYRDEGRLTIMTLGEFEYGRKGYPRRIK